MRKRLADDNITERDTNIVTRELTPADWSILERLFGSNGACGGCWCMSWRTEKGEKWDDIKGLCAKQRQKDLIESGKSQGILAFLGEEPIGWCSFGRRVEFPKLNRSPSLKCDDAHQVWSIPCFFVRSDFRNRGVAGLLLAHAVESLKCRKASIVEAYPVKSKQSSAKSIPDAFAWTGTESLFTKAGFRSVGSKDGGKIRVRLELP